MTTKSQTEKSKSWSRRKRARPGEILDAAMKAFAEKGFAATRMDDIAAAAGVTKGTIYLYFSSKEDVFKSLARQTVGQVLADVGQRMASASGDPREQIRTILSTIDAILHASDRVALPKIIISESGNFPELARFWRTEVIDKAMALLAEAYERGVAAGQFRDLPAHFVTRLCLAPLLLGVIWRSTFVPLEAQPLAFDGFFETHIDVLMNGLKAQGEQP